MNTAFKSLLAVAVALSFTACSTDTTKNADGSTTTEVTTPSTDQAEAKMDAAGDKMEAKMDAAGNKMDAMGDAAAKSARQTKENMKAAAKQ